ncbi:MAG TPA: nicotinate-nucleotide--dimethylbenzimidazole phosphoribosyltransferase [Hyphomicrobiales bacterium]|nr:nicotinate-nucleotide--dimethylbenzimidazole phosphoribosyltransferase [Kaistiaceae bacterium]HQF30249.1 nicotinate-nucleotide--dimethylbenzimidazole phosphoribosyltransferase [Hyphomicrobiales bacterium]
MAADRPFDDIRNLVARLPGPDTGAAARAVARLGDEAGSAERLGRARDIVAWLATWIGDPQPRVDRPLVAVFAASGTVATRTGEGDPVAATRARVTALTDGSALVNHVCATQDLGLKVFELAVEVPTPDIVAANAFDENGCAATFAFGMEAVAGGNDLLVLSSTGAGGDVAAAALVAALGADGEGWLDEAGRVAAAAARARVAAKSGDALDTLRRTGSREIAALAGAIVAARYERVPVILDGIPALAAAVLLKGLDASAIDHCLLAEVPAGAAAVAAALGLRPLLDMGLGEGAAGAMAATLVRAAASAVESLTEGRDEN